MKTATKATLFAIFSLFLTACDKPANKPAQQPEATAPTQPAPKAEEAKPEAKPEATPANTGAQDYKTLREWQDAQEKALNDAVLSATNNLSEKQKADEAVMQETVNKALLTQIDSIKTSAEALNIQDAEVKALKDKTIEVLTLGTQMIVEGAAMEKNPTPEAHKAFGELQTKLNQLAEEGQQLENQLRAKYEPAPQQ